MLEEGRPLPEALREVSVLDEERREHRLGALVEGQVTVVVFLRHFGCIGCSRHVTELSPRLPELDAIGVRTVFVGNGTPRMMRDFVERHRLEDRAVTLVTDPAREAYRAAGLHRSWWSAFGPRAIAGEVAALTKGYVRGEVLGDGLQQGGAFVVDAEGVVRLAHRSRATADNVDGSALVAAATTAVVRRARAEGREEIV